MRITQSSAKSPKKKRGRSSAGRAPALHAGGQEFDPPRLHHYLVVISFAVRMLLSNEFHQNRMHSASVLCSGKTET